MSASDPIKNATTQLMNAIVVNDKKNVNEALQLGAYAKATCGVNQHAAQHKDIIQNVDITKYSRAELEKIRLGFHHHTALTLATKFNADSEIIEKLIKSGAWIDVMEGFGYTPLMLAAEKGNLKSVQILIASRADVNKRDRINHETVLMITAKNGHLDIAQLLIDEGANLEALTNNVQRRTALMITAENPKNNNQEAMIALLIKNGANFTLINGLRDQRCVQLVQKVCGDLKIDFNKFLYGEFVPPNINALIGQEMPKVARLYEVLKSNNIDRNTIPIIQSYLIPDSTVVESLKTPLIDGLTAAEKEENNHYLISYNRRLAIAVKKALDGLNQVSTLTAATTEAASAGSKGSDPLVDSKINAEAVEIEQHNSLASRLAESQKKLHMHKAQGMGSAAAITPHANQLKDNTQMPLPPQTPPQPMVVQPPADPKLPKPNKPSIS